MKDILKYIDERLQLNKDSKIKKVKKRKIPESRIVNRYCPGFSFDWVGVKDRWAVKGDPCMHYSLICYPDDMSKDIIVLCGYAWYEGGYDQGYSSSRKLYLATVLGGGRGCGHGQDRETEPYDLDDHEWKSLYEYLTKGTHWNDNTKKRMDKIKAEYPPETKKSEIRQSLSH